MRVRPVLIMCSVLLLTSALLVTAARTVDLAGTDHRPVVAEVARK